MQCIDKPLITFHRAGCTVDDRHVGSGVWINPIDIAIRVAVEKGLSVKRKGGSIRIGHPGHRFAAAGKSQIGLCNGVGDLFKGKSGEMQG